MRLTLIVGEEEVEKEVSASELEQLISDRILVKGGTVSYGRTIAIPNSYGSKEESFHSLPIDCSLALEMLGPSIGGPNASVLNKTYARVLRNKLWTALRLCYLHVNFFLWQRAVARGLNEADQIESDINDFRDGKGPQAPGAGAPAEK